MITDEYEARLEWEDHTRLLPVEESDEDRERAYERDNQPWTIEFPAYRLEAFTAKISQANGRLLRAGADVAFAPTLEAFTKTQVVEKVEVEVPWYRATMDRFDLTLGDYTFIAALVAEEAGYTVHAAPGQNLDGWTRPDVNDIHCDHCGTTRQRTRVYIIRENSTGRLIQLGHNCIELYLGLHPKGLWALQFDEELERFAREDTGENFGARDYGAPIDAVLAYAWVFSDQGRDYQSTKVRDWGGTPTVDIVRTALFVPPRPPYRPTPEAMADYRAYLAQLDEADRVAREEGDLLAAIRASVESVKEGTDYGDNLRVILAGERVSGRNVGILASLVAVYAREESLRVERERAPKPAKGFLAPVGTRIRTEISLVLRTVRSRESEWGTRTFLVGYTPDQHCVVWSTGWLDVQVGDTLVLSAATVKAHEEYQGIDQTVVTRAKVARVEKKGE